MTPRTHFTRDRQMDGRTDGRTESRSKDMLCSKRLRPKKPTENIGGQRSYTVDHRMQVFYLYNGRTQQTIRNNILTECVSRHMYVSFGEGSSLLWTLTLKPFYSRPIALTQERRSLVNDVCECVHDCRVRRDE